jgi:hypothetical protein
MLLLSKQSAWCWHRRLSTSLPTGKRQVAEYCCPSVAFLHFIWPPSAGAFFLTLTWLAFHCLFVNFVVSFQRRTGLSFMIQNIVTYRAVTRQRPLLGTPRKQQQKDGVLSAVLADGCSRNNGTTTEERYFRCGPCRDILSRTVLELVRGETWVESVSQWRVHWWFSQSTVVVQSLLAVTVTSTVIVREPRGRGTSAVGSRYQATANENWEDFMYAVVRVIFGVCNSLRLS